jgi:hypothetical protein
MNKLDLIIMELISKELRSIKAKTMHQKGREDDNPIGIRHVICFFT